MGSVSVLVSSLLMCTCVQAAPSDCRVNYQNFLQSAADLKKKCNGAGFKDCCQAKELVPQAGSDIYEVADVCDNSAASFLVGSYQLLASCDMETDGGKWMVIQKRFNNSVDFYRNWTDYVNGFGDLEGEFWYGLEKIHCLTTREDVELRIELGNETTPSIAWTYQLFRVGGAETNYRLTIGQGQGQGGTYDSMTYSNGQEFSTPDRDNDRYSGSCATKFDGAWWYNTCGDSNLNSIYGYHSHFFQGICWYDGTQYHHYTKVAMKVRPKRCSVDSTTNCSN